MPKRIRIAFPGGVAVPPRDYPLSAVGGSIVSTFGDVIWRVGSTASTGGPFLAFSDLTSGPKSGNTDTSQGAASGADGVYVTVWGNRLGSSQGSSVITVGGVECRVIYWGPAVPPYSPANLDNGIMHMQCVIFQVMGTCPDGATSIRVTVNSVDSNTLPFTVRTGRILYVTPTGTASGSGAWTSPLNANQNTLNAKINQSGDTVYLKDVSFTGGNGLDASLWLGIGGPSGLNGSTMTENRPGALVAYPGSSVTIGRYGPPDNCSIGLRIYEGGSKPYPEIGCPWWTISKLYLRGGRYAYHRGVHSAGRQRIIGLNYRAMSDTVGSDGIIGLSSEFTNVFGCEFHTCGSYNTWTHVAYFGGSQGQRQRWCDDPSDPAYKQYPPVIAGEQTSEFAWNYLRENSVFDGWHSFSQNSRLRGPGGINATVYLNDSCTYDIDNQYSSYSGGAFVHNNLIVDQGGVGASWTSMCAGHNYVWSNLIVRAGATVPYDVGLETYQSGGVTYPGQGTNRFGSSCAFRLSGGVWDGTFAGYTWNDLQLTFEPVHYHIFHNTVFDCGNAINNPDTLRSTGVSTPVAEYGGWARHQTSFPLRRVEDISNNITYLPTGTPFIAANRYPGIATDFPNPQEVGAWHHNLWHGPNAQNPLTFDVSGVRGDPLFYGPALSGQVDCHLMAGSAAIGAGGTVLNLPPGFDMYDFDGNPLPVTGGQDIGALQRV